MLLLVLTTFRVPLFEIWFEATRSLAVTNTFIVLFTVVGLLTVIGSVATASRLTWAFGRDDGLLGSTFIKKISSKQKIPVNALAYNTIWITALGCLYMASTSGKRLAVLRKGLQNGC